MLPGPALLPLLVVSAVSIEPAAVPARGDAYAIIRVDRPAMVRLAAKSPGGTSCEVVDHVRGPFARSGEAGKSSCELDLLLDQGIYKVRLASPANGQGTVALEARAFKDRGQAELLLVPGHHPVGELQPGEQTSYWLSLSKRQPVTLRVSGRTAGQVALWRQGEWLEPLPWRKALVQPRPGQPIAEWWLETQLDPGDYRLTVYGTGAAAWTQGKEENFLSVEYGFAPAPVERSADVTIPAWGLVALELPPQATAAVATLDASPALPVDFAVYGSAGETTHLLRPLRTCRVAARATVPQCAVLAEASGRHVMVLRGAPGTRAHLEWGTWNDAQAWWWSSGFAEAQTSYQLRPRASGEYLVAAHDVPMDTDAAPLGCALETIDKPVTLARDVTVVSPEHPLSHAFNYDGHSARVWFEVTTTDRYRVQTSGGRKSRCELFQLEPERRRVSQSTTAPGPCELSATLGRGTYQLELYEGREGIEQLSVRAEAGKVGTAVAAKSSCVLPKVSLSADTNYRLQLSRAGTVLARGLELVPLPLSLDGAVHLTVEAGATVRLPLSRGVEALVRVPGGAAFQCGADDALAAAVDGVCRVPRSLLFASTLTIANPGKQALAVTVSRPPSPAAALPAPRPYTPTAVSLARLPVGEPTYFAFERGESRSLLFDVTEPGLYDATTVGLLATSCSMRTAVVPAMASDRSGGRGRNCLVASYLRPGRYLLTVTAQGQSRGRAGVVLARRPVREGPAVTADGEAFYRAAEGELWRQRVSVGTQGDYDLTTVGQAAQLQCRLDDSDGWPVAPVPIPCRGVRSLKAGSYLWAQLPLTVESQRHTRLQRVLPPQRLAGEQPHRLQFFTWYDATLGADGKDDFRFALEGEAEISVSLTQGMQGRLYRLSGEGQPKPVGLVAPQGAAPAAAMEPSSEGPSATFDEAGEPAHRDCESEECESPPEPVRAGPTPPLPATALPALPPGQKVTLGPGEYQLVTEHSRGDVAVEYRVFLGTQTLLPGMERTLPAPVRVAVRVPRDGVVRLRTSGDADVRCRLFDARGKRVLESSDNGADWNCSAAEPLPRGSYQLVIEVENLRPGSTQVALSMPRVRELGEVRPEQPLAVSNDVIRLSLPPPAGEAVDALTLQGARPFSCALEESDGTVSFRRSQVTRCELLVRTSPSPQHLRVWTTEGAVDVRLSHVRRRVQPRGSELPAQGAVTVSLSRPGRFATSPTVQCLEAHRQGPLRPCGPQVSLEAGPVVFAALGASAAPLPLTEVVHSAGAAQGRPLGLSQQPFVETQQSPSPALQLLSVKVPHGSPTSPACELVGGVREWQETACHAVAGVAPSALARVWGSTDEPVEAQVVRQAVSLPQSTVRLASGRQRVRWTGPAAALELPREAHSRLELTLDRGTWAIRLDDAGRASDLCAPWPELRRCVMSARGGRVVLLGSTGEADATLTRVEAPERAVAFGGALEEVMRAPGTLRLRLPPGPGERTALVEGSLRCVLALDDGRRATGCRHAVPPSLGGELLVEHGVGPLRALLFPTGRDKWARLALEPHKNPPDALASDVALPLGPAAVDRALVVDSDRLVSVRADTGVCGLWRQNDLLAADGTDSGCAIDRLVSKGTYRLVVRAFGQSPLSGTVRWTSEPVAKLTEGIGAEEWVAPGELRLFQFATRSAGKVGIGLSVAAERLSCELFDDSNARLGTGCQQYVGVSEGRYLLAVRNPPRVGATPLRFRPVVLGLAGAKARVPDEYLRDFFRRLSASGELP